MTSSSSELRRKAREALGGNIFGEAWIYALLVCLIISAINSASAMVLVGPLLLAGPLTVGSAIYFTSIHRAKGQGADQLDALLKPFKEKLADNILLGILMSVYTALWFMLFFIPGIVKTYSYAMAPYIKADHPEYTPTEVITESRRIMNGNKMRLFCLQLSFIGWFFVSMFTLGIGMLWVTPYISAATAAFYEEIRDEHILGLDEEPIAENIIDTDEEKLS